MSKQRIPPFSPTPTFLGKIFHPQPYCQIRGNQPPFVKGRFELCLVKGNHIAVFYQSYCQFFQSFCKQYQYHLLFTAC